MGTIHFQNSIDNIIYCEYLRTIHSMKNVVVSINTFIFLLFTYWNTILFLF